MRRILYLSLLLAAAPAAMSAQDKKTPPTKAPAAQVQRGRELFEKSPKGIPCGTCHSLAGVGMAVGPDLKP